METVERLRELEEFLLRGDVRRDPALAGALLATEFREFGSSGKAFSREQILRELQAEEPASLTLTEFEARPLSEEVFLVTYRSRREAGDGSVREALRSSIWQRTGAGEWKIVFHQGTRIA